MSTRGLIARQTGEGFTGRYHHFDAYPSGLGKTLYALSQQGPVEGMLAMLIDAHPAGWSSINDVDWSLEPGFTESGKRDNRPACYCHGDRHEPAWDCDQSNAAGSGVEYAYVFTSNNHMLVLSSYCEDGEKMIGWFGAGDEKARWVTLADVDLAAPEPDWEHME